MPRYVFLYRLNCIFNSNLSIETWGRAQVHCLQYQLDTVVDRCLRFNGYLIITGVTPKNKQYNNNDDDDDDDDDMIQWDLSIIATLRPPKRSKKVILLLYNNCAEVKLAYGTQLDGRCGCREKMIIKILKQGAHITHVFGFQCDLALKSHILQI